MQHVMVACATARDGSYKRGGDVRRWEVARCGHRKVLVSFRIPEGFDIAPSPSVMADKVPLLVVRKIPVESRVADRWLPRGAQPDGCMRGLAFAVVRGLERAARS